MFLKLSRHFVKQSAPARRKNTHPRKQNKQTIHLFLSVQNRQNEKSWLLYAYNCKKKYKFNSWAN